MKLDQLAATVQQDERLPPTPLCMQSTPGPAKIDCVLSGDRDGQEKPTGGSRPPINMLRAHVHPIL